MAWVGYWLFYLFPVATLLGAGWGGWGVWLAPTLAGGLVPLAESLLGDDTTNPAPEHERGLAAQRRWRLPLYLFVPLQWGVLLWACHHAAAVGAWGWVGLVLSVGVVNGGLAINVAHELCHGLAALDQAAARLLWLSVGYGHFHIEHRLGHHVRVATPLDPATARLGETVYAFYLRSIRGGYASAWALERARLSGLGHRTLSWHNHMLWYAALTLACPVGLGLAWGPAAAGFYVLQAVAAVLVLETVNYLEHYGLERVMVAPGEFEPVGIGHSWNSSRRLTNCLLLELQRHSDHHAHPWRRYQLLRSLAEGPQLPTGYGGMVLLALVPPLWFRVMDPRARACRAIAPDLIQEAQPVSR